MLEYLSEDPVFVVELIGPADSAPEDIREFVEMAERLAAEAGNPRVERTASDSRPGELRRVHPATVLLAADAARGT